MSRDELEREPEEDLLASRLAEFDEALRMGADTSALRSTDAEGQVHDRLASNLECVQLLRWRWQEADDGESASAEKAPPNIGRFQIRRELGHGGNGVVFLAYDPQLRREVALKVPRINVLSNPELGLRFQQEARAAALLDHPHIAAVFEAGQAGPISYITSCYCPGPTLGAWIGDLATPVPERIAASLALLLAEAVQHAHSRGVLHRDLKPSNIILSPQPHDSDAERASCELDVIPKVTDFGLAKLMADDEAAHTHTGAVLGTPNYMSPEQAAGRSKDITTATDVYGLGAILYEMLTGRPPIEGDSTVQALRLVESQEPIAPRHDRPNLSRDLETICLKCLRKDPRDRYPTALALADDLRHYLAGEPVAARPISRPQRMVRWSRRNPLAASLVAAVALLLVAGTTISTLFAIEAGARAREAEQEREHAITAQALESQQRQRAQEAERQATQDAHRAGLEAEKAQQVAGFLSRMFEETAPIEVGGLRFSMTEKQRSDADLTAREILERGRQRVSAELQDQPLIQAALLDTMGNVYIGLGLAKQAELLVQQSLELRQQHLPHDHLDVASSLHSLGVVRFGQHRAADSVSSLREGLAVRRKLLGDDHPLVEQSRMALATVLALWRPGGKADVQESVILWRESLAWHRAHRGDAHRDTGFAMLGLAGALFNLGEFDEPARWIMQATPILLKDPATKPLGIGISELQKAILLGRIGASEGSADAARRAIEAVRDAVEDGHPIKIYVHGFAAPALISAGKLDEAEAVCRPYLEGTFDDGSPPSASAADFAQLMAKVQALRFAKTHDPKMLDEAEKMFRHSLAIQQAYELEPDVELIETMAEPIERVDATRAESLCRLAFDYSKESYSRQVASGKTNPRGVTAYARSAIALAALLGRTDRVAEAESLYRDALTIVRNDKYDFLSMWILRDLADLSQKQGHFSDAEPLYREALKMHASLLGKDTDPRSWESAITTRLGQCLAAQAKLEEAEATFQAVIEQEGRNWPLEATKNWVELRRRTSGPDEAERTFAQVLTMMRRSLERDGAKDTAMRPRAAVFTQNVLACGADLLAAGKNDQAIALYTDSLQFLFKRKEPSAWQIVPALAGLNSQHELVDQAVERMSAEVAAQRTALERPANSKTKQPGKPKMDDFAQLVTTLADVLRARGQLAAVESLYGDSLPLARQHVDELHTLCFLKELGDVKQQQGAPADAERYYRESFELAKHYITLQHDQGARRLQTVTIALADCLAAQEKWSESQDIYRAAADANPRDAVLWHLWSASHLLSGDLEGYRRAGQQVFGQFVNVRDAEARTHAFDACLRADSDAAFSARVLRAATGTQPRLLAAALCRAGKYQESLDQFATLPKSDYGAWDWCFMAIAHQHLGQGHQARQSLEEAAQSSKDRKASRLERLETEFLLRQVESLLNASESPPKPVR